MERIDIHCHPIPPLYRDYLIRNGQEHPDGMPIIPPWSAEEHIDLMKMTGITKSILSISSPGTHLTPGDGRRATDFTRAINTEMSEICAAHPESFAFFASLPLPEIDASLNEIDYALDFLGAKGFVMMSNSNGIYPGDKILEPIFEKLNQRAAVVFLHPTTCKVAHSEPINGNTQALQATIKSITPMAPWPSPMMEFFFDETRAVVSLLLSGTVERFSKVIFIMSHAGCSLPPLLDRVAGFARAVGGGSNQSESFRHLLKTRFFFDLAGAVFPDQVHGLLRLVGPGRLCYGSDYAFTPAEYVKGLALIMDVEMDKIFDKEEKEAIYHLTAKELLKL